MTRRFQIEDLISQDASGVVFRALDSETGQMVALWRIFPLGSGGKLLDENRPGYSEALARLSTARHPALRSVVGGGWDPVDGVPFIATEWLEGVPLSSIVAHQVLAGDVAILLLIQALEVAERISEVMGEEAVWVETRLDTIVLGNDESGRGFTFIVSPQRWLNGQNQPRGFGTIRSFTEEIMGWKGKNVANDAGYGLGAWFNWLQKAPGTTTLREAREHLATTVGIAS